MDVKYINPFLSSLINVLSQFGVQDIERGQIIRKNKMEVEKEITSIIGLVGDVRGNLALCFSDTTARTLASTMMMGMPVEEMNAMSRSAIGEFTNMVSGNALTMLSQQSIVSDVSPPSIISGEDIYMIISRVETLAIIFETSVGAIEVNIGLEM